jgi:hypothetical protein
MWLTLSNAYRLAILCSIEWLEIMDKYLRILEFYGQICNVAFEQFKMLPSVIIC